MRLLSPIRGRCYCAYCKSERKVYLKKHVDMTNVVLTMAFAWGLSTLIWHWSDSRFVVLWSIFMVTAEMFIYLRWRISLPCQLCGFDPIVYKRNPTEAARLIGQFFQEKTRDPEFSLTRSPLLEVYREMKQKERRDQEYERVLNKAKAPQATKAPVKKGSQVSRTV